MSLSRISHRAFVTTYPPAVRLSHILSPRSSARRYATRPAPPTQAFPLVGFYAEILENPLTPANALPPGLVAPNPPASTPASVPFSPNAPTTSSDAEEREARARVVFGTRLAGPGDAEERERNKREKGQMIAGIWVPPKPIEPDNCCMSGCVNCVLTQFVEDLDEWKVAKRRAERAAEAAQRGEDDAGGEVAEEGLWEGFEDIPMGLRVFMETEKRLNRKQASEK